MNNKTKKVAVVIPCYKTILSNDEKISLKHLNKFLGRYDKFFISPNSVGKLSFDIPKIKTIYFPDEYFTSVQKYSELLTTKSFYEKFLGYEYILIYQFDALVFSDQLLSWCNKGYDYIGAPLYNSVIGNLSHKKGSPASVGNGGFSLRKVSSFIRTIDLAESVAGRTLANRKIGQFWFLLAALTNRSHGIWLNCPPQDYPFNEDGFWSFEAVKYYPEFKVAPFREALKFSFEKFPEKCIRLNNKKLPFGCHAWARYNRIFWDKYLVS